MLPVTNIHFVLSVFMNAVEFIALQIFVVHYASRRLCELLESSFYFPQRILALYKIKQRENLKVNNAILYLGNPHVLRAAHHVTIDVMFAFQLDS